MTKPSPPAWLALALLTGVNLVNYVDRYVPAGALPLILKTFGASDTAGGLLQSLFMVPYAAVSPLIGALGDRRRRFAIAGIGVLVWSLATFASGLAPTFCALLVARVVIGVGEASYSVVTPPLLGDYYPPERRGRALSIFYAAIPVGSAIGFMIGGAVGSHLGWRWAFFLAGAPGALLALALVTLADPSRGTMDRATATAPRAASTSTTATTTTNTSATDAIRPAPPWAALLLYPSYLFNVAAQTIYTFAMGGLANWMPTYFVRERGLSLSRASLVFGGIVCLAGFIGTLVGGQLGDRLARRAPASHFAVSGCALIASLPFTLLAILAPSPAIFWPAMFVTLTLLFFNTGPLNAAMANVLPPALRARGFGVSTMSIHLLGDALSPFLIGLASDLVGLRWPVLVTGALLVVSGAALLFGRAALVRDLARARGTFAPEATA